MPHKPLCLILLISKVKFLSYLDVECYCGVVFVSLLFGNLIVYFLFAGEMYITAESRTLLFIILTAAAISGVLLMLFFCQQPMANADFSTVSV